MTPISFTANLSGVLAFTGIVKIKCDDIPEGGNVQWQEDRNDGEYETVSGGSLFGHQWGLIGYGETSKLFDLRGNYKILRSHSTISVGYEE